jgi:adenylate cyclase
MAGPEVKRRLAAILAADVAGYTKLMAGDETATVAALDAARLVFREHIEANGGRVVDMAGDSVLAVFETATGATEAALAVQKALAESEAPEERRMRFRVGVHLGEMMEKPDGSVYGDGVNLAARLEGLASPAGICISAAVCDQIAGKVNETFVDIGERSVKNVARPIRAFAWGGVGPEPAPAPRPKGRKPIIAVSELSVTGGSDAEALAAGVRDDIARALSNQTALDVIADPAQADYVVRAALQARGEQYRANIVLLDHESGRHLASQRFDGDVSDTFQTQDDLAYSMSAWIRFAVHEHQVAQAEQRPAAEDDIEALLDKAGHLMFSPDVSAFAEARRLTDSVLAAEPQNFMALAIKANTHLSEMAGGYKVMSHEDKAACLEAASEAVRLNGESDYAHLVLGHAHLLAAGDFDAARAEAEQCFQINPYYSFGFSLLGFVSTMSGQAEQGVELGLKTLKATPRSAGDHWTMQRIALGHFALGDYAAAMDWASRSCQRQPDSTRALLILASAAGQAGDDVKVGQAADRIMALHPEFRICDFGNWPFRDPEPAAHLVEGLRLAGLPE